MKVFITFAFLLCSSAISLAQGNPAGTSGVGGSGAGNGNSQSTGYIPSNGEENLQYKPDTTHSDKDTSYMHQQWNNGATSNPKKTTPKSSKKKK